MGSSISPPNREYLATTSGIADASIQEAEGERQRNPTVDRSSGYDYRFLAPRCVGVMSASGWLEMSARPGSTAAK